MPRTKGAINKPKSKEYHIQKLKELGLDLTEKTGKAVKQKVKEKLPEKTQEIIDILTTKTKKTFELDKPETEKTETELLTGDVLRCGNPACGKVLESQYSVCPFCGANLKWQ